jgi:CheY-like chemotaxis protein
MTSSPLPSRVAHILLAEDNPGDIVLTVAALKDSKIPNEISVVQDGEQALAFLRKQGEHAGAPRPDLVLLDLNLPRVDGREVLAAIKEDPDLRRIPVVVLTGSRRHEDVTGAYNQYANTFITKPDGPDQFMQIVAEIERFWLGAAKLS